MKLRIYSGFVKGAARHVEEIEMSFEHRRAGSVSPWTADNAMLLDKYLVVADLHLRSEEISLSGNLLSLNSWTSALNSEYN